VVDLALRHRVQRRLSGSLRVVCFNNAGAIVIPMASQEYNSGSVFDSLKAVMVNRIFRGEVPKGPEGTLWTPAVQCSLLGIVF